jgi:hypothetical protein
MLIDIKGKINEKKLAFSNTLLPLFEAIVNSIQAIEEDSSTKTGIIEIDIIRSNQKNMDFGTADTLPDIVDFQIKDNGVGFTEQISNHSTLHILPIKLIKAEKG